MPAAMSLVPSSTEPPPTESRKSTFSALPWAMALRRVSILGLGSMPQNSTKSRPLSAATTWSYTPFFLTEPPPKVTMIFLVGRNLFRQLGDGAFAEDQLDRILESEVVHTFLVYSVCFPDEVPQGSFCRVESIVSSFIFYAAFSRYRLYPDSFSFCSSYMRSRNLVAARKSNDLAARSISSRARRSACRCSRSSRPT